MSFLSRLKSKIEEQREELHELGQGSRTSVVDYRKNSRPQTGIPPAKRKKQNAINTIDLENSIHELQAELEKEQSKNNELKSSILARQERYVKREQEYRITVAEYERKLIEGAATKETKLNFSASKDLEKINHYHEQIIGRIGVVQQKTMVLLKEQEMDIVKEFNMKLGEKCKELEDEKKKDSEKGEITQKESKLLEELEANKSQIDVIDTKNKYLTQRNNELKIQLKSHDQDQKILEEQISSLRITNERLKKSLEFCRASYSIPQSIPRGKSARVKSAISRTSEKEPPNQYQSVINKLKRMIELEQKNTRAARTAYARELEGKKELENMLRMCVDDVKSHITKKRSEQRMHNSEKSIDDLEKVIDILLSQERVLTLLYDKTFPPRSVMREPFFNGCDSRAMLNDEDDYFEIVDDIEGSPEISNTDI